MRLDLVRPLTYVAAGLVLVALDFRTDVPDLLPDPVGWSLVAVGAWRLSARPAAAVAGVAAVLSLADVALPYRYVHLDPLTGEVLSDEVGEAQGLPLHQRWENLSDRRALVLGIGIAAGGLAVWLIGRALTERAARSSDRPADRRLRLAAAVVPAVWAVPALVLVGEGVAGDGYDPIWDGNLELPRVGRHAGAHLAGPAARARPRPVLGVLDRSAGAAVRTCSRVPPTAGWRS